MKDISGFKFFREMFHGLGFHDLQDMATSVLALKNIYMAVPVATVSFLTSLIIYTEGYIYTPLSSLIIFWLAIFAESATGTLVNIRVKKEKWDWDKALRFFSKLVGQSVLLALAHNFGKATELYGWLPIFIWISISGINFLKTARNLTKLNWIDGSILKMIESKFGNNDLTDKKGEHER